MAAYYNEIDPYAAQWLRNLIAAGHIAPGEVDERSILDVLPVDLVGYDQCHFFAGIGVWSYALQQAGWADDRPVWTGSAPCQPFSAAGKGDEFADERHLWPAWFQLIRECRPVAVFGEQVASRDALAWLDHVCADLEGEGYAVGAVDTCAAGFGAPHIRQRLYWVADSEGERRGWRTDNSDEGRRECSLADSGAALAVADAEGGDREVSIRERRPDEGMAEPRGRGRVGELADADSRGDSRGSRSMGAAANCYESEEPEPRRVGAQIGNGRATCELADAGLSASARLRADSGRSLREQETVGPGEGGVLGRIMGNPDDARSQGRRQRGNGTGELPTRAASVANATNGFWRDAEWLPCRDGKARPVERAVESMLEQMASGVADSLGLVRDGHRPYFSPLIEKGKNRVGRLRGYGNSIVAPAAAAFIEAFMDCSP